MTTFKKLKNSALGYRFVDENFNCIPKEDIKKFKVYSPEKARRIWSKYVSSENFHLMKLSSIFLNGLNQVENIDLDSDNFVEGQQKLRQINLLEPKDKLLFFWTGNTLMKVNWEVFIKYWDDFCYPSDDSNLMILKKKKVMITYVEEKLTIYKF